MTRQSGGPPAEPVIALDRLTKRFGHFVAVDGAALTVARGEFFSLLGPSGCGKTTTLRMIAGFERPSSGRVLLEGNDVSSVPPYRRNVNTVFQHYALFPHMSVRDNVAFGPRSHGVEAREVARRVTEMLEIVRLGHLAGRKPAYLSGGQQQRVALARALVNYPSALLLDEPLGALDLQLRKTMQLELKRIQRDIGISFVYVTHDQEEALTMSDRIAVMNEGRIEQVGTPEEVYREPATVFVASFIGTANLIPARVETCGKDGVTATVGGAHAVSATVGSWSGSRGDPVTVMVRPERVRVAAMPSGDGPSIPVTLTTTIFQGAVLRVSMRTVDGVEIVAHVSGDRVPDGLAEGARAYAAWDARAARLLPPGRPVDPVEGPALSAERAYKEA